MKKEKILKKLKDLDEEEFRISMSDFLTYEEKERLREIRDEQRELHKKLKEMESE